MPIESALVLLITGVVLLVIYAADNALMLAALVFLHVETADDLDGEWERINGGVR